MRQWGGGIGGAPYKKMGVNKNKKQKILYAKQKNKILYARSYDRGVIRRARSTVGNEGGLEVQIQYTVN